MTYTAASIPLLGGRLSLDFVNTTPPNAELSWERLIRFLEATNIVSSERSAQLLSLPQSDPQAAEALLVKARRLGSALRKGGTNGVCERLDSQSWPRAKSRRPAVDARRRQPIVLLLHRRLGP